MASSDGQRPRRRDRVRQFLTIRGQSQRSRSPQPTDQQPSQQASQSNPGDASVTSQLGAANEPAAQHGSYGVGKLQRQAFEKFSKLHRKESETLQKYIDKNENATRWQHDLIDFLEKERKSAEQKRLKIRISIAGEPLYMNDVFGKFVEWVDKMISVGDAVVQYDPAHAALPWAAFRFVLKSAVNYTKTQKSVWAGIDAVCRNMVWMDIQERLFLKNDRRQAHQALHDSCIAFYVEIFALLSKYVHYYEDKTISKFFKSPFVSDAACEESLMQLAKWCDEVHKYSKQVTREDQMQQHEKICEFLEQIKASVNAVEETSSKIFEMMADSKREAVLTWLSPVPYSDQYSSAIDKALPNTGMWLFSTPEYTAWSTCKESKVLRVHGGPGTGKSTLLSQVIRRLQMKRDRSPPGWGLNPVWFYCTRSAANPEGQDSIEVLRCLLRQLAHAGNQKSIHSAIVQKHSNRNDSGRPQSAETVALCKRVINDTAPALILIDALDECSSEGRRNLLESLLELLSECSRTVKVFLTSRDDRDESAYEGFPEIRINAKCNGRDIKGYIKYELDRLINKRKILDGRVSPELRQEISQRLIDGADGMFRWVALQLQLISYRTDEKTVRKCLTHLHPRLRESYAAVYDHEMQQLSRDVDQTPYQVTLQTFKWLLIAKTIVRFTQFCKLVGHVDESGAPRQKSVLVQSCFGLIEYDGTLDILKFCHLSVREFLESEGFRADNVDFHTERLHEYGSLRCLELNDLKFDDTNSHSANRDKGDYFSANWPYHAMKAASCRQREPLKSRLEEMLFKPDSFEAIDAVHTYDQHRCDDRSWDPNPPPLHPTSQFSLGSLMVACDWNLFEFIRPMAHGVSLVTLNKVQRKFKYIENQSLLEVATAGGHVEALEILLDLNMDVEGFLPESGTPLCIATENGDVIAMRLLLRRGANIDAIKPDRDTALAVAGSEGKLDAMKLLLDHGANINIVGGKSGTALAVVASKGKLDAVKLLLERGADINIVGGEYGTVLAAAAFWGKLDMIKLLLDYGADINIVGGEYGTALATTAFWGHLNAMKLLLDRGADINIVGGDFGTALAAAAYWCLTDAIKLLLDHGADINIVGGKYGTALAAAAYWGHLNAMKLLLDRGADVNIVGGEYGTALTAVTHWGRLNEIRLLLDHGADINIVGGEYGTALATAAFWGHLNAMKLLLDRGAGVNIAGGRYGTPLAAAASRGKLDAMKLLLDRGADVNIVGGDYGTAFATAAYKDQSEAVKLLISRGARTDLEDDLDAPLLDSSNQGQNGTSSLLPMSGA